MQCSRVPTGWHNGSGGDGEDPRDLHEHCLREGLFTFSFVQSIGSVAERWMDGWAKACVCCVRVCRKDAGKMEQIVLCPKNICDLICLTSPEVTCQRVEGWHGEKSNKATGKVADIRLFFFKKGQK